MSYGDDMVPAGTAHDPRAPWHEGDPDPLVCDTCWSDSECVDDQIGDQCNKYFNKITDKPTSDEDPNGERCEGRYESTRCDTCGHLACDCE